MQEVFKNALDLVTHLCLGGKLETKKVAYIKMLPGIGKASGRDSGFNSTQRQGEK